MVTKEALCRLLETCISQAVNEAQSEVADPLPTECYLGLEAFEERGKELTCIST